MPPCGRHSAVADLLLIVLEFMVVFWILVLLGSSESVANSEFLRILGSPYSSEQGSFSDNPYVPIGLMSQPLLTTVSIVNICTYYIGDLASWQEFCSLAGLGGDAMRAQVCFQMLFLRQNSLERIAVETLWINQFKECL